MFLHHAWPTALHPDSSTGALAIVGTQLRLGLFLFFVLSGFLLYRGFIRHLRQDTRPDLGRYLKRRAARILPAYYFAVLGSFALFSLTAAKAHLPPAEHLPLFAVFAQNYSAETFKTLDSPTWTLCIEAAFYLVLPVLAVALMRVRAGWRFQAAVIAGMVAVGVAWATVASMLGAGVVWTNMLPVWLPYFAFGMAVALWIEYAQPRQIAPRRTAALVVLGVSLVIANGLLLGLAGEGSPAGVIVADLPAGIGFALITALALMGSGGAVAWTRLRWLIGVGIVSYGFYLWHMPLLILVYAVHPAGGILSTIVVGLPLALLLGLLSWRLVERPAIRASARGSLRRPAPVPTPTPA